MSIYLSDSGIVTDIKRFAVHDGDGIRTTVFLKGCPLSCIWCHNPESISHSPQLSYISEKCITCGECCTVCSSGAHSIRDGRHIFERELCLGCGACADICLGRALKLYGRVMKVSEVIDTVMEDSVFYGCTGGITLSGGEPTAQPGFMLSLLRGAKEKCLNTALDTCGYVGSEILEAAIPYTDTFLYDIKHISPESHLQAVGKDNRIILRNLELLSERGARLELRLPLIPGFNDAPETLDAIAELLSDKRISALRILPYHCFARSKYEALGLPCRLPEVNSPGRYELEAAAKHFTDSGIKVILP